MDAESVLYLGGVLNTRQALVGLTPKSSTVFTGLQKSLSLLWREEVRFHPVLPQGSLRSWPLRLGSEDLPSPTKHRINHF